MRADSYPTLRRNRNLGLLLVQGTCYCASFDSLTETSEREGGHAMKIMMRVIHFELEEVKGKREDKEIGKVSWKK